MNVGLSRSARIVLAIALAVLAHGVAGLIILCGDWSVPSSASSIVAASDHASAEKSNDQPLELETFVDELKRPDEPTREDKQRQAEIKKEEESRRPPGQVVALAKPAIEERPDNANYVSEYDSKVDHQTRGAVGRDQAGSRAEKKGHVAQAGVDQGNAAINLQGGQAGQPRPSGERTKVAVPDRALADRPPGARDEALHPDEEGERGQVGQAPAPGARPQAQPQPPAASGSGVERPNLLATREILEHATGQGAGSPDYLHDIDDSDATSLNSKKWKYASFFNQVKHAVAEQWHPDVVYIRHDPSGNVYGVKDRVTVLRVQLFPDGKIAAMPTVTRSCGVDFLDDEAVDAFKRSQPFPNPPKGLVEADGQIHFTFGFVFELSGRTKFQLLQ